MNEMPFCTQLALQLETVNAVIEPVLTGEQRDEVDETVARFEHTLADVDHSVGAMAVLRIASALLGRIVSTSSRIAS